MFSDLKGRKKHFFVGILLLFTIGIILANVWSAGFSWTRTDVPTHAVKLFLLDHLGYGQTTYVWNYPIGYTLFRTYPPLFFIFALPFLALAKLAGAVEPYLLAFALAGMGLLALLAFILQRFVFRDRFKTLVFVTSVFFNALAVNWIFETGRFPEFSGWALFAALFALGVAQGEKPWSLKKIGIAALLFGALMMAHPTMFIMSLLLWGVLFLARARAEILPLLAPVAGLVLSAAWWLPYFAAKKALLLDQFVGFLIRPAFLFVNAFNVLAVVLVGAAFWMHQKQNGFLARFFGLFFIFGLLELSGIFSSIPFLNQSSQQTFILFLGWIGMWGVLTGKLPVRVHAHEKKIQVLGVLVLLASCGYTVYKFHDFASQDSMDARWGAGTLDAIGARIDSPYTCIPDCGGELSYWTVKDARTTSDNFSPEATPIAIFQQKSVLRTALEDRECGSAQSAAAGMELGQVVAQGSVCDSLAACGFPLEFSTKGWCVARVPGS